MGASIASDALVNCFSYLNYCSDMPAVEQVCKSWNKAAQSEQIAKIFYQRQYGVSVSLGEGRKWRDLLVGPYIEIESGRFEEKLFLSRSNPATDPHCLRVQSVRRSDGKLYYVEYRTGNQIRIIDRQTNEVKTPNIPYAAIPRDILLQDTHFVALYQRNVDIQKLDDNTTTLSYPALMKQMSLYNNRWLVGIDATLNPPKLVILDFRTLWPRQVPFPFPAQLEPGSWPSLILGCFQDYVIVRLNQKIILMNLVTHEIVNLVENPVEQFERRNLTAWTDGEKVYTLSIKNFSRYNEKYCVRVWNDIKTPLSEEITLPVYSSLSSSFYDDREDFICTMHGHYLFLISRGFDDYFNDLFGRAVKGFCLLVYNLKKSKLIFQRKFTNFFPTAMHFDEGKLVINGEETFEKGGTIILNFTKRPLNLSAESNVISKPHLSYWQMISDFVRRIFEVIQAFVKGVKRHANLKLFLPAVRLLKI